MSPIRVGLCVALLNNPGLYLHFKGGPFGVATIMDMWEAMGKYMGAFVREEGYNLALPL